MNASPLRGVAALALLCLLPRASALTQLVQNQTIVVQSSVIAEFPRQATGETTFAKYDGGGSLSRLTVQIDSVFHGLTFERNPFLTPMVWPYSWLFTSSVHVPGSTSEFRSVHAPGETVIINEPFPIGSATRTIDLPHSWQFHISEPGALAAITGSGSVTLSVFNIMAQASSFGRDSFTAEHHISLTYGVTDTGSPFGLAVFALGLCVWCHRRMNPGPSRPTE